MNTPTLFAPYELDGLPVLPYGAEYPAPAVATATIDAQEQAADLRRADVCRMCWRDLRDLCRQYHIPLASGSLAEMRAEVLQREGLEL